MDEAGPWFYLAPLEEPDASWKTADFVKTAWSSGPGGIGYGDDDDATVIEPTLSVFMRTDMQVVDPDEILQARLLIDYDDAFVAYLNGVEIGRSGLGANGETGPFDRPADVSHEARLVSGGVPDIVEVDADLLVSGQNHLAVQIHNTRLDSSDLSSRIFFAVGMAGEEQTYLPLPDWFEEPMTSSNLPLVFIDTEGQSIGDDPRISARMRVVNNGEGALNAVADPATDYDGWISIEWRGSTSQGFPRSNMAWKRKTSRGEQQRSWECPPKTIGFSMRHTAISRWFVMCWLTI